MPRTGNKSSRAHDGVADAHLPGRETRHPSISGGRSPRSVHKIPENAGLPPFLRDPSRPPLPTPPFQCQPERQPVRPTGLAHTYNGNASRGGSFGAGGSGFIHPTPCKTALPLVSGFEGTISREGPGSRCQALIFRLQDCERRGGGGYERWQVRDLY